MYLHYMEPRLECQVNILEMDMIESGLVMDWPWDDMESLAPDRARLKRERQAYEEAERGGRKIERNNGGNYAGTSQDILQF